LPENDKPFRSWIKKITYGRYTPPAEATVHSELCKLHAETEIIVRKNISDYLVLTYVTAYLIVLAITECLPFQNLGGENDG
jgi:hypothetical protein